MKKSTTFTNLIQTLLKEEDVQQILRELNFEDTARKFTAHQLLLFFMQRLAVWLQFVIPPSLPKRVKFPMRYSSAYFTC